MGELSCDLGFNDLKKTPEASPHHKPLKNWMSPGSLKKIMAYNESYGYCY